VAITGEANRHESPGVYMRPLQLIHCVVTAMLAVVIVTLGLLLVTGVIEIRLPSDADGQGKRAEGKQENGAPIRGRLVVVRGAKPAPARWTAQCGWAICRPGRPP
jgi:hypothetical protein